MVFKLVKRDIGLVPGAAQFDEEQEFRDEVNIDLYRSLGSSVL